jgi:hypothetical protein
LLLQRRAPGRELKPHSVINDGEPAGSECDALAIDTRDMLAFCAWQRDLRFDREVRLGGERQALAASVVVVDWRLDDRPRPGVARHLQVGEDEMVRTPVGPVDGGVGGAFQLVLEAALDQSAEDRLCGLVAVKREAATSGS